MSLALASETSAAISAFQSRRRSLLIWRGILVGLVIAAGLILTLALLDRAWFIPESALPWLSMTAYAAALFLAWKKALSFIQEAQQTRDAARLLEAAEPALRQRLLAAVELATTGDAADLPDSPEFRARLQQDVAAASKDLRWRDIVPSKSLRPWALRLMGILLLATGLSFIPQLHLPGFLTRAALPFAKIERPSSVKIKIISPDPASTLVPYVSEVPLTVELAGQIPERVMVEFAELSATLRSVEMQRLSETRFEALLPVGQSDLRYRISGGDAQTLWHLLDARPRPAVTQFVKTIVPPAYTGLPPSTLDEDHGDVEALDGSIVRLELAINQPVKTAAIALNSEDPTPPAPVTAVLASPDKIQAEFPVKESNHTWQPDLIGAETGFTNEESTPWRITTIPDLPPTVTITDPKDQIQSLPDESLRIRGIATDDIGLKQLALSRSLNAGEWTTAPLPAPTGKESPIETLVALPALHLEAGDSLQIKLIATDLKGQTAESNILQIAILQQTVDPRLRAWAEAQTKLASTASTLEQQTRELRDAASKVQKDAQLQQRGKPAVDPQGQLARMKSALDQAQATADDLWKQVKDAAATAPDALTRQEAQLLGQRVSKLRAAPLPALKEAAQNTIQDTDLIRRQSAEAAALADALNKAAQLFSAEATAQIAQQSAAHQARQAAMLTENALPANRDASQRAKWQQQQRAAMATTSTVQQDLANLEAVIPDKGMARQTEQLEAQIAEASRDLAESLDRKDQTKSPEHLYGAADNLRQRLSRAADATRGMAENLAQRAAQLREQMSRQENPALATLDDAKAALQDAATDAKNPPKKPRPSKDGLTAAQRAEKRLAEAARQLQDQSDLRQQATAQADQGSVDANRASRAADQLARETAAAAEKADPAALATAQEKATQLAKAARTLEADAAVQSAQEALAANPGDKPDLTRQAADARAASESLKRATEPLRRDQATQAAANLSQQASDLARSAADQLQDQARQAQTNRDFQPSPVANREQAAQKAAELAAAIAPAADAAREALGTLTPAVSEMMKALAQDLRKTQEDTQSAAADAKAEKPVDDVAKQAQNIQPKAATDAQRMEAVQAALRTEANQADLAQADQRQLSRTADVALAQMQGKSPQIAQNLKQAAQANASQPQAQALDAAAAMQQQTAEALDQLAQNFSQMEQGKELSEQELAALTQMEQQMGVEEPLDAAYDRAQELAAIEEMAQEDPAAALALLEKELPKNPVMQKALAEIGKQTAINTEQAVTQELLQPVSTGMATAQAAHDLQRVARHAQRLGDAATAQQVAQASKELQQAAKTAKENPNTPTPESSKSATAAAQQASKAAEMTADSAPPAMAADPFQQLQSTLLAQALDQLDQTVHPAMGDQPGQQQPSDQQQGQQQQGQQQGAQQSLADANQSQQQSMAQSRNQGKVPGSQQSQSAQNLAKNQQQSPNNTAQNSSEGGNFDTQIKDGALTGEVILVQGDWGHLPSKTADELSEATRQDAPPEYRAAIENYYKSIATRSKQR